jgi:pyrroline-5-carboxylate reductase
MNDLAIGFVGGGRVARIILEGLRRAGAQFSRVSIVEPDPQVRELLRKSLPSLPIAEGGPVEVAGEPLIFIAIHPPAYEAALAALRPHMRKDSVVVSLAPKRSIAAIKDALGGFGRIVRMIPNAPSIINRGYNPICFSPELEEGGRVVVREVLGLLGTVPEVPEDHLEAYAVVAGMGPTYLWFQLEELKRLGIEFGLPESDAARAVAFMAEGAARTLHESGLTPEQVMDLVPVRPLASCEDSIREFYRKGLKPLYAKLK